MKNNRYNVVILVIAVFFLSTSAIFAKIIDASSDIIAFYRLLFSGVILIPIILTNKTIKSELYGLTIRQTILGIVSGAFLASHYVLWFESLNYTSVASSTTIVTLQPLFAVIFAYLLYKEKLERKALIGIVVAIIGSLVIGWSDFETSTLALYGDLLAFIAAGLITAYFFVGQSLRKTIGVISYSFLGYISSSVLLLIYGLINKSNFIQYEPITWLQLIGMAVFSTLLGQLVINWVLKWLGPTTVSVGILSEVIWAILLSILLINETLEFKQLIGVIIIFMGLTFYIMNHNYKNQK